MRKEKTKMDSVTYEMEYLNLMQGGSENQYYSLDLVASAQKIKKAWYPKTQDEYFENKKTRFGDIKKHNNEVRVISMDIAISATTKRSINDATVIKCVRAIQNGEKYERQEVYTESFEGVDIDTQAIRVHQLLNDFEADYFVFDARTYGTNLVDSLAKIIYDPERDIEYTPIKVFNNEALAERCKNPTARAMAWAFIGTAETNHNLHSTMFSSLKDGKYKMLESHVINKTEYLQDVRQYKIASPEEKARMELPYIMSDLTLHEMVNLNKEYVQGSRIKLVEPNNGTKDKYVTSAMANLFIQELEMELTRKDDAESMLDYCFF